MKRGFPQRGIIRCFGSLDIIIFAKYLDIHYVYIHNKNNIYRKANISYNLEPWGYYYIAPPRHYQNHWHVRG
jgi:hypothetical protein